MVMGFTSQIVLASILLVSDVEQAVFTPGGAAQGKMIVGVPNQKMADALGGRPIGTSPAKPKGRAKKMLGPQNIQAELQAQELAHALGQQPARGRHFRGVSEVNCTLVELLMRRRDARILTTETVPSFRVAVYAPHSLENISGSVEQGAFLATMMREKADVWHRASLGAADGTAPSNRSAGPKPVFVDVGARTGFHTLYAAALGYRAVAFEATAMNAELLLYSMCLNPQLDVGLYQVPLAAQMSACVIENQGGSLIGEGAVHCHDVKSELTYLRRRRGEGLDNATASQPEDGVEHERRQVGLAYPLDYFSQLPTAQLLKIDVHGMELCVLQGGVQYIRRTQPSDIVTVLDAELLKRMGCGDAQAFFSMIDSFGYELRGPIKGTEDGKAIFSADRAPKSSPGSMDVHLVFKGNRHPVAMTNPRPAGTTPK